jgi:hypothetical protein
MPKTLAALPRSQYPTDLDDASGHDFLAAACVLIAGEEEELILFPSEPNGVVDACRLLTCRMARTIGEEGSDGGRCWCRHRRQTNGDRMDLPATLRRPGRRIDIFFLAALRV